MNQGKYVFSQLFSFVSHNEFLAIVKRYDGDHYVKHFSCWKQYLVMAFGQICHRESMSDTIYCLSRNSSKLYQLGIGQTIVKSTISKANESRDWRIFRDFTLKLIEQAQKLYIDQTLDDEIKNSIFAIDATVIDLCLTFFTWAQFRRNKAAVKLHTILDLHTNLPEYVFISSGSVHEVNILDLISFQQDSIYIMDRGYVDYKRLYQIHRAKAFFIVRAKENMNFKRVNAKVIDNKTGLRCDQTIKLIGFYASQHYPESIRRIKFYDAEEQRWYVFITNNHLLTALQICNLYKQRWQIELFFKWIKQHLKIKTMWGHTENAVKTQIWIALSIYVLVAIIRKKLKLQQSMYEILQVLSVNLIDKTPLIELFSDAENQNFKERIDNQLKLF